eukprot:TRINITY_DN80532_c0_g1_i1.p1 TRINITY_DN80532_c0_g1~~TRINITY_DN80532_c0_g1_i1.p1  ORF type:complete len:326 (-),score=54.13 TRINITY_DN80532_c0_g1_i1:155-1003(-)
MFQVTSSKHEEIVSSIAEEPNMKALVDDCMAKLGAAMDKIIGRSDVDLDCRFSSIRTQETNIGNWVTDIMRKSLKADLAVLNSGTLRADSVIEKGEFKTRDLVNMLPMLDELCLLQISGQQIMSVLENSVSQYPRLEGRFAQVSGVNFSFDAAKPAGQRVVDGSIKIGGEPISLEKSYKLCTKDYLRQGKDGFDVFKECTCLADGETAGILPSLIRSEFQALQVANGISEEGAAPAKRSSILQAQRTLDQSAVAKVGDGPDIMKMWAIAPKVEGRILCLNPA